jgi:hypothetical protein
MMVAEMRALAVAIIDRREIEFDQQAVTRALEWSPRAAQAFGLPPLTPNGVRCNPVDGCIEVIYGELTSTRVFALRAEALGAILISYCNRTGMPMPRLADKAVRIERAHVVVVFTLRLDGAPQPEGPEGAIGRAPEAVRAWSWIEPVR